MDFRQGGDGYASILVDATTDKRGIWWALIERKVSDKMDLRLMQKPNHELRIEACVRVSHAPRRVNLQVATQRSTDDDANLNGVRHRRYYQLARHQHDNAWF